jgi:flavin-dependent dehydrogenase
VKPISDVAVMAGLRSVLRTGTHNGAPLLSGVIAIGDAYATTNPLFGRGLALALRHAAVVTDTLRAYPALGPEAEYLLARRLFDATHPAWYDAVRHDDHRTRMWCRTLGIAGPEGGPIPGIPIGMAMGAAFRDAGMYVRMLRAMQLLDDPTAFFDDGRLANEITAMNLVPPPGPTRADVLAAVERQRHPAPDASLR